MAKETILLTGATGNVGSVTLEHLLQEGHYVNAVLRNAGKSISFFEYKFPSAVSSGQLKFTSVPDMTVDGAFDLAAASATAIMHIATPLADGDWVKTMIEPTWAIDHNILTAAKASKTVKRVIICGTILQTMRVDTDLRNPGVTISEKDYNSLSFEESKDGPWALAYMFSKTNAEKKMCAWVKENEGSIGFDVVMLLPPSITGRSPQIGYRPTPDGPGGISWVQKRLLFGTDGEVGDSYPFFLDTDDVARTHLIALDRHRVPGNERFLTVSSEPLDLKLIGNKLREEYPELKGRIPESKDAYSGRLDNVFCKVDTSKADNIFGRDWKSGYDSVKGIVFDVLKWEKENLN